MLYFTVVFGCVSRMPDVSHINESSRCSCAVLLYAMFLLLIYSDYQILMAYAVMHHYVL